MDDQVIEPGVLEQTDFFRLGVEQEKVLLCPDHKTWMRIKSQDEACGVLCVRIGNQPLDDFPVAGVDAVKSSQCQDGFLAGSKFRYGLVYAQGSNLSAKVTKNGAILNNRQTS